MFSSNKALTNNKQFATTLTPCLTKASLAMAICFAMFGCSKPINSEQASDTTPIKEVTQPSRVKIAEVDVINPSTFARKDEAIYFSYYDLGIEKPKKNSSIEVLHQEKQLSTQHIDSDYDGVNDGILFLIDLIDNKVNTVTINTVKMNTINEKTGINQPVFKKRVQAEISHKVDGNWLAHTKPAKHLIDKNLQEYQGGKFKNVTQLTPPDYYSDHSNWIRYEGPGIESDKVGYRIYLDWRNGFDIFGKLTEEPILSKIGQDGYESYHHMQPWGMDILKVGGSLGAGGFGLMTDDKNSTLEHISEVKTRQAIIAENGNIQSRVNINYLGWKNSLNTQNLTANISMIAGSRLAKVHLNLEKDLPNITAGVVKHQGSKLIQGNIDISGYQYSYIASWGKQSLDDSMLGMAIFFKKGQLIKTLEDEKNYLVQLKPRGKSGETAVEYYFASVWQPESGIDNEAEFIAYLKQEADKLTRKPRTYLSTALTEQATSTPLKAEGALNWGIALADSELNRKALGYFHNGWDVNRARKPKFEYDIIGLQPYTFDLLADLTGDEKYRQVIEQVTASFITDDGKILAYNKKNFNIDNIPPGRNLLRLYKRTQDEKFRLAATALRQQLTEHPKTSQGAFWHKNKYTNQLWLDGVYMGMPFLAEYAMMFEEGHQQQESLHEVINEFKLTRKYLRDEKSGLYYHGWDESKEQSWANKSTGQSPEFWARGVGWLAMAIVDVLDSIPEKNIDDRKFLIEMVSELADTLAKVQDQTSGAWWQVLDKPNAVGNYKESSATAMFTYFFAKAINNGYLTDDYNNIAQSAFKALINEFTVVHLDGATSMTNQCYVAGLSFGRDGSYGYYMNEPVSVNDPKGTSPYILASIEMYKLLNKN
ncbi:glycoside hydrolase family 88 protein [Thalassotalea castellviae]|uniref:Glycoside hydrolase family 88 protein n=1 Tax=Thalassotalea castellviae TaxID=3075612 RepID=A0ABU2ZX56_9GAMM|nr:glycoside hydrolase family 88 protein [Thalassotalea sp. W431]MDT0602513.1 glycoside hydrolase family 88 protein [Thalassotalea sp. W431]